MQRVANYSMGSFQYTNNNSIYQLNAWNFQFRKMLVYIFKFMLPILNEMIFKLENN